jgi:hypothetical protein
VGILEFLENHYELKETSRKDEVRIHCPSCDDIGFHGYFNIEKNVWRCFRCGVSQSSGKKGFTAVQFLIKFHSMSPRQAREIIDGGDNLDALIIKGRRKSLKEVKEELMSEEIEVSKPLPIEVKLPESYPIDPNDSSRVGQAAWVYLLSRIRSRKRAVALCKKLNLRYCTKGKFAKRLILPVYDGERLVYFQGRSFFPHTMRPPYLNVEEERPLFMPYPPNIPHTYILCEGYFDALAIGEGAISIFGSAMTDLQFFNLMLLFPKEVIVCLDPDPAGIKGMIQTCDRLNAFVEDLKVVRTLEKDPSDIGIKVRSIIESEACGYTNYVRSQIVLQE